MYYDSMYNGSLYVGMDSFLINISIPSNSETAMTLTGMCSAINFKGLPGYEATVDTSVGDSATATQGQIYCTQADTISGYITRDRVDSPAVLHFYLQVTLANDSAIINHYGSARLIQ